MRILALETSARAASAALSEDGRILGLAYQDTALTHSRTLMPLVRDLLRNADLSLDAIDAVAAAAGPGSFTGLRIGIAAAQGLALGAEKQTVAVSTLAAMARNIAFAGGMAVCVMDARRAQVYNALFSCGDGVPVRLTEDRAISLEDLAADLARDPRPKTLVGDGAELCAEFLSQRGIPYRLAPPHLRLQNAASVALEAEALARQGALVSPRELRPFYLRPPYALPLRERQGASRP